MNHQYQFTAGVALSQLAPGSGPREQFTAPQALHFLDPPVKGAAHLGQVAWPGMSISAGLSVVD